MAPPHINLEDTQFEDKKINIHLFYPPNDIFNDILEILELAHKTVNNKNNKKKRK